MPHNHFHLRFDDTHQEFVASVTLDNMPEFEGRGELLSEALSELAEQLKEAEI